MNRFCFLFLLILFFSAQILHAQVGLLSTNNKEVRNKSAGDTSSTPRLSITKEVGPVVTASDTNKISIPVKNQGIDSVQELKSDINRRKDAISKSNFNLKAIDERIHEVRDRLALAKNENATKREEYNKQIRQLEEQSDELRKLIFEQKKDNDSLNKLLGEQVSRINLTDTLNDRLINEVIENLSNSLDIKLNTLKKQNENIAVDLYKNQYNINSYWFLIDSTKEPFDRNKFMDTLSGIYSSIRFQTDAAAFNMQTIFKSLEKLYSLKVSSNSADITSSKDYDDLRKKWQEIVLDTAAIAQRQHNVYQSLQMTIDKYNSLIKNNVKDKVVKKDSKTTDFGAFPQLTSILGKREVIPQLQAYGSYVQKNATNSFEGNIGLSFAPTSAPDTANLYTLFIASASKFLVQSNFTWSFATVGTTDDDAANLLGVRLEVNFANKNLVFDTLKTVRSFSSSIVYTKAGIEFGILPRRLSIYGNLNTATILDKVSEFKAATGLSNAFFKYSDLGARFYLDPTPKAKVDDKLFVYANINCIINSRDVKKVSKNEDAVIPTIQIGIVKSLGKF